MKHGSLFSGIGGIDLGFEMAGIETVWNCEIDEWCRDLLKKRFPDATQYDNVETIGKHNLEPVDIISGGFPCQDISVAGKGEGLDGKRSGLWFEMHRIISELRPRFALIENVQLLTKRGGTRVLSDLAEIGYDAEWQIISAPVLVQDTYARGSGLSPTQRRIPTPCALDASFPLDLERNLMKKEMKKGNWRGVKLPNYLNMFPTPKAFQDGTTPEKMEELEKENPKYFKARMQHLSTRLRYEEHQKDQEKITKYPTPVASNIQSPQPDRVERNQSGGLF